MLQATRRTMLGTALLGAGAALSGCGFAEAGEQTTRKGRLLLDRMSGVSSGLRNAIEFPLIEAIHGRRSRRFAKGTSIPDGPLAYDSKNPPEPLSEQEQLLLLTTMSGNTGWSNLIPYNRYYLPRIPNYAGAAGGRSFPSAAGFHTTEIFYTDDDGVYFFPTRDLPALNARTDSDNLDLDSYLAQHKAKIVKLADGRLHTPATPQHMEMHNDWCANVAGSTLVMPVADLAQHHILGLCYLVQNGACIFDDTKHKPIPGIGNFRNLVDIENPYPMSFIDQMSLTEVTVEVSTSCYAGMLMQQAMGLGGWMYGGINPFTILGASGDPAVPGLGFRFDTDDRWPLPNVTGLEGVFEGHCPPHFPTMRDAVDAVIDRKFGAAGPFNAKTQGPYRENAKVRGSAAKHDKAFRDCVALMCQYIFDEYGRFPASVPSIFTMMYLQSHQLDLGFYDTHFDPGAYLPTHANHDRNWSSSNSTED